MFSLIIPAYNEEKAIGKVLSDLRPLYGEAEIIVVDDGSRDNTVKIASEFPVKVIRHDRNRGNGAAIKTGVRNATTNIIVTFDADDTYVGQDITKVLKLIEGHDMVVGARVGSNIAIPLIRRPAKWFITKLASYLVNYNIPDLNSGLRVIKKDVLEKFYPILPDGFSLHTTITLSLLSNDYKVAFVPIAYNKRIGKSKIKPIRDTYNFLQLIIRVVMYFNPLRIFLPASLFLFFLSFVFLAYDIFILLNITEKSVITFNTAFLVLVVGLLADLINKRLAIR